MNSENPYLTSNPTHDSYLRVPRSVPYDVPDLEDRVDSAQPARDADNNYPHIIYTDPSTIRTNTDSIIRSSPSQAVLQRTLIETPPFTEGPFVGFSSPDPSQENFISRREHIQRYHRQQYQSHHERAPAPIRARVISRPRRSRPISTPLMVSGRTLAKLAKEIKEHYELSQKLKPAIEIGQIWLQTMHPSTQFGFIPQSEVKDVDCAKKIYSVWLQDAGRDEDVFMLKGPSVSIEDMRAHMEDYLQTYQELIAEHLKEMRDDIETELSTRFLRNHATLLFTAFARWSNFVHMDVVIGTYIWIDDYLSVKYALRTDHEDSAERDKFIPVLDVATSIRSRASSAAGD